MKPSELLNWIAFYGARWEASDIVEYLAICASLLLSPLMAAGFVFTVNRFLGLWGSLIVGLGVFLTCMRVCSLVYMHVHGNG
jgi:hypothetical protein